MSTRGNSSETLSCSRDLMAEYDGNVKEMKYLEQKIRLQRERLGSMYSRADIRTVKTMNKDYGKTQDFLHSTLDAIREGEEKIQKLKEEQEKFMAMVDLLVEREHALVIRGYHELGLSFSQIGQLYHMGRSTVHRSYWKGMERLGEALVRGEYRAA